MENEPYTKREVDLIMDKMAVHHKATTDWLAKIDAKVEYTNGKVKRVILVIAVISALLVGVGFKDVIPFIISII